MYKIVWLLISCLVALSLVLPSCAPGVTEEEKVEEEVVEEEVVEEEEDWNEKQKKEKPKYGGTLIYSRSSDTGGFDQIYTGTGWENPQFLVNDRLLIGDWTRGAAGTNEFDFAMGGGWAASGQMEHVGHVAESWEVPDDQTIIFHIRQGVYFHNKPPVNGRELDANDVAFSIEYMYLNPKMPMAYNVTSAPVVEGELMKLLSATATDQWTVVVKMTGMALAFFEDLAVKGVHLVAHESIEKYGNLKDWRNALGTGGFELIDYIPGSSFTFVKNPNYWLKNPIGPGKGDQLPYVDKVKWLIIIDKSTELAAFRTGKIDTGSTLTYEEYQDIMRTNPQTKFKEALGASLPAFGPNNYQVNNPLIEPFQNRRVRWALSMALDREAVIRDYYKGAATEWVCFFPVTSPYHTSLDEKVEILEKVFGMKPEEAIWVKKIFEYHPDEAKKILAEEGYPNGFKTKVLCSPAQIDVLSIYAGFWDKIGVELELDVRDSVVYSNIRDSKTYPGTGLFTYHALITNPAKWVIFGTPAEPTGPFHLTNYWNWWDPVFHDYYERTNAIYGQYEEVSKLFREFDAWVAWNMHGIVFPVPTLYRVWQPWLKDYYGIVVTGFRSHYASFNLVWIDQELKKEMGR